MKKRLIEELEVTEIIEKNSLKNGILFVLESIYKKYGELPIKAMRIVAKNTGYKYEEIFKVALLNEMLSKKPQAKIKIEVCDCISCHLRGSEKILRLFEHLLRIKSGQITKDAQISLVVTPRSLGNCSNGPIVRVGGNYFTCVEPSDVSRIIEKAQKKDGVENKEQSEEVKTPIRLKCVNCGSSLLDEDHIIENRPSFSLRFKSEHEEGLISISSLFNSKEIVYDPEIKDDSSMELFCPHCKEEIKGTFKCVYCCSWLIPFMTDKGTVLHLCSRKGCTRHYVDYETAIA